MHHLVPGKQKAKRVHLKKTLRVPGPEQAICSSIEAKASDTFIKVTGVH